MTRRVSGGFTAAIAAVLFLASCGGSGGKATGSTSASTTVAQLASGAVAPAPSVKVAEIRAAVAAVEAQLGGKQRFSEVNATQTEVNVFVVAGAGVESAYLVRGGVVEPPSSTSDYSGPTFGASDLTFRETVLDKVLSGITDSELVAFSATPRSDGEVDYIATFTAPSGEFRVLLAADGSVLSTSAISPATGP